MEMENESGLRPLGVAVLIKPYEPELKGGSIMIPDFVKNKMAMVDNRAVVVAVGPAAWMDEPAPRAAVGDHVLVTKFAGFQALGDDGQMYRFVNDRDIFAGITPGGADPVSQAGSGRIPVNAAAAATAEV